MTRRLARRVGAGAALLLAILVATPASPAGAEPTITIADPKDKQVLDSSTLTVRVSAPADLVYRAKEITWSVGGKTGNDPWLPLAGAGMLFVALGVRRRVAAAQPARTDERVSR